MRASLNLVLAATLLAGAVPAAAQNFPRGDEPVQVSGAIKQGIDFVYVDPALKNVASTRQRPTNWLSRLFNPASARRGQPHPMFLGLQQGLQRYQAEWGRLPQNKIAAGATMKLGSTGKRVAQLRQRLGLAPGNVYDAQVAQAVSAYQHVHGLGPVDGIAGKGTIGSLNRGARYYEAKIAINMERAFRLPKGGTFDRYVLVDSGAAQTFLYARDRVADQMRVIVGDPKTKTPMMAVLMTNAKANPYWHVPPELAKSLTAQKVKELGATNYFRDFHYEVMSDWNGNARPLDPASIDWAKVRASKALPTFMVRQKPGPWNSMGMMKFEMPNDFGIYLHDTPLKEKFAGDRWISNGCVRLEDYRRFATWVFPQAPQPSGQPEEVIRLPRPVPVFMTYFTVAPDPRGVIFRPDPYGFDAQAMPQMFGRA